MRHAEQRRRRTAPRTFGLIAALSGAILLAGCATIQQQSSISSSAGGAATSPTIEEALTNLGIASPRSLLQAENSLGESTAGYSNYGLELSYVTYKMIQILYPLYLKPEYVIYPPTSSIYPELFNQVQSGKFPSVNQNDVSFLTLIIPPMAVLFSDKPDVVESSLEALDHAAALNPSSVLPPYLKGLIDERKGNERAALSEYERALSIDGSCYPAALGKARVLLSQQHLEEAATTLDSLVPTIPPDAEAFRLLAEARFRLGSLTPAYAAVKQALDLTPESAPALILAARIHEAQKDYSTALTEVDQAEKAKGVTPETILLRARLQRERGNQAGAVEVLAAGVKKYPDNKAISDAYGKLLIETGQTAEGGKYLSQSNTQNPNGADNLELLVTKAISSKDWKTAEGYLPRLLSLRTTVQTLRQAYTVYKALGDSATTEEYARKLHELAPTQGEYLVDYVESLISTDKKETAMSMIDSAINKGASPATLSSLYYLRSRLQTSSGPQLHDLRSALFENLENEQALIAITRYYVKEGNLHAARIYAQQANEFLPSGERLPDDISTLLRSGS